MANNYFEELFNVNVNNYTEEKNGLTYLSWSFAIGEVLKRFPNMTYEIERFEDNKPYVYDEKTGYMVFTKVTIDGVTREMWLPVMDGNNKAMLDHEYTYQVKNYKTGGYTEKTVAKATMFDINKTIMRCLVKNFGVFGLGLYIYNGCDIPEQEQAELDKPATEEQIKKITKLVGEKRLPAMLAYYKLKDIKDMTNAIATEIITTKEKAPKKEPSVEPVSA